MKFLRWIIGAIVLKLDAIFVPALSVLSEEETKRAQVALAGHTLFEFRACPFCVKVRRFLRSAGLSLPLRDAKTEPFRSELLAGGGKLQVPCLRIESSGSVRWMYESADIISYLKQKTRDISQA